MKESLDKYSLRCTLRKTKMTKAMNKICIMIDVDKSTDAGKYISLPHLDLQYTYD